MQEVHGTGSWLRGPILLLVGLLVAVILVQTTWMLAASHLARPANPEGLGLLTTLDLRVESLVVAVDSAWMLGDARVALPSATALVAELNDAPDVAFGAAITAQLATLDLELARLVTLLDDEMPHVTNYSDARELLLALQEPAAAVADAARERVTLPIDRLRDGTLVASTVSSVGLLVAVMAIRRYARRTSRLVRRQERRLRASRAVTSRVRHEADHDALTGLPNRRYLLRELGRRVERARRFGESFALHLLDVDDLKRVNDTYGHHAGDAVLTELARVLKAGVRAGDIVGRLAGDEFLVLQSCADADGADRLAQRLHTRLRQPVDVDGTEFVTLSASLGTAFFGSGGQTATELLHAADLALYQAKTRPKLETGRPQLTALASA